VRAFVASGAGCRVRQIRQRRLLDYLQRQLKQLELPGHLHTFRHTFISLVLTHGLPEATVRKWVGHVDAEMIRRNTHISSQESHAAMQRLRSAVCAGLFRGCNRRRTSVASRQWQ
jgi:integrase